MAKTFNLDSLDSDNVFITPSLNEKDYAYSLLYSSNYDDCQRGAFDDELSDKGLGMDRFNEIVSKLKMNQADSPNPGMKEIQKQLDDRLARDNEKS